MKYLLIVNFQPGVEQAPMEEWKPEEIEAHLDYYRVLNRELESTGELVQHEVDLIFASDVPAAKAAQLATTRIPIVLAGLGGNPVGMGLIQSFA